MSRRGKPVIVCLCGYQGHGKTEVARYLERAHGFHREPFAESIRAMLCAAGVPTGAFARDRKDEPHDACDGRTPRDDMESLGEWGRGRSPLYWSRVWSRRLTRAGDPPQVVVDDARFDLETAYAMGEARRRGAGFLIVQVHREGRSAGTAHESNRLPDTPPGADRVLVTNRAELADLFGLVDAALRERGYL